MASWCNDFSVKNTQYDNAPCFIFLIFCDNNVWFNTNFVQTQNDDSAGLIYFTLYNMSFLTPGYPHIHALPFYGMNYELCCHFNSISC